MAVDSEEVGPPFPARVGDVIVASVKVATPGGAVKKGDSIEFISRDENRVSVNDLVRLRTSPKPDVEIIKRALRVQSLPDNYRETLLERIGKHTAKPPNLKNL